MQQVEWEVVMLRKAFHSACCLTYGFAVSESNYRANLMALSVGRFAGSGVGHAPEYLTGFCGIGIPKRHTFALISLTSREMRERMLTDSLTQKNAIKTERTKCMMNSDRERKRILMVEDHEDDWEMVELKLSEYKLTFARDFDKGLRLARRGYFDLYILDNWLPGGSGIGLCRAIREYDPYTPILFYSAAAYERDIQEALRAGAQAYLVKPVRLDEIELAVVRLTSPVSGRGAEAWRAEMAAIREELAIQQAENARRMEVGRERRLRAEEKLMRLKAEKAFLGAGGTRGEFARRWPSVFTEEVRGQRKPDATSGH